MSREKTKSFRERIAESDDRTFVFVKVKEWDLEIEIRSMTMKEKMSLGNKHPGESETAVAIYAVIEQAWVPIADEDGKLIPLHPDAVRVFTVEDFEMLENKSSTVLTGLFYGLGKVNNVLAEKVEAVAKN